MIQLGSTGYMIYLSDHMIDEPSLWPGTFIIPGTYGICAGTNTAGALTQWMREQWYQEMEDKEESPFHLMELDAAGVPAGSEGLICLPYFAGERTPINDPEARGCFFGLQTCHTRGHMVRSALEGICYTLKANLEMMRKHNLPVQRILVVGGGTKNSVWLQCLSDILEEELCIPKVTVGASYGDALMAALAHGAFKNWQELSDNIQIEKVCIPNPENFKIYRKQGKIFKELYEVTKEFMHQL